MKFQIQKPQENQNFSLIYGDHSFDIEPFEEPFRGSGERSILINYVQLEFDHEEKIMYVWGYCPLVNYTETEEYPSGYKLGTLVVLLEKPLVLGASLRLNDDRWPIFINKKKGWVYIGDLTTKDKQLIEFAPDCVAVMNKEQITALWLHPKGFSFDHKHSKSHDK